MVDNLPPNHRVSEGPSVSLETVIKILAALTPFALTLIDKFRRRTGHRRTRKSDRKGLRTVSAESVTEVVREERRGEAEGHP